MKHGVNLRKQGFIALYPAQTFKLCLYRCVDQNIAVNSRDYRNQIKNRLEIENFSGRLADNIRQDFYATMVLTNLTSDFAAEAQIEVEQEQRGKGKKYRYKVNMNHAIGVSKDKGRIWQMRVRFIALTSIKKQFIHN